MPARLFHFLLLLTTLSTSEFAHAFIVRPASGLITLDPTYPPSWGIRLRSVPRSTTEGGDESENENENENDENDDDDLPPLESDELFLERFRRRRNRVASSIDIVRSTRPPSPHIDDPRDVVSAILDGLRCPHSPVPYFGYEVLYMTSTTRWQEVLRRSVGASTTTTTTTTMTNATYGTSTTTTVDDGLVCRALGSSIERPGNQFKILVRSGMNVDSESSSSSSSSSSNSANGIDGRYVVEYPHDALDYYDGSAWLECRLRDGVSDALLAVLGWSMKRRDDDGAWLVDGIDWQDFREDYRPGIGREEWERICG
ncbi:hypothetical protein ACHAXA_011847 [Cyclostephanos tholiformis]|uniref:Uncharacterized protein n=1 Tax=Cyclostephanos tholiformis TaxID=382380 RepID=A0ABD3RWE6_9STRA